MKPESLGGCGGMHNNCLYSDLSKRIGSWEVSKIGVLLSLVAACFAIAILLQCWILRQYLRSRRESQ